MPEERLTVDGVELWTATDGAGPHVVLCHGGFGVWDAAAGLSAMLTDVATVHRYDQRGCGRSAGASAPTVAALVDELEALRRAWGVDRWIAGGHSAGASLALLYAAAFPARTRAVLYLCGTGLSWPRWRARYRAAADARLTAAQRAERDRLEQVVRGAVPASPEYAAIHDAYCTLAWAPDFADRARATELAAGLVGHGLRVNFDANRTLNADWNALCADPARRAPLAAVACPVLLLHGADDPRPVDAVRELAEALPHARLEVIAGAGHYPWLEQPEPSRRVLRDFVATIP